MVGDPSDMAVRMRAVVPKGWFGDETPVLDGLLQGLGVAWSFIYSFLQFTILQARISTATGTFLDMIGVDFFGPYLVRFGAEADDAFRQRVKDELLRPRATREALILALQELTGRPPLVFEPSLPSDTGGYAVGGVGFGVAGGWGNLALPFQSFITAYRPAGTGLPYLAGYSTGGIPVIGALSLEPSQIRDADINAAITRVLPASVVAWTCIRS